MRKMVQQDQNRRDEIGVVEVTQLGELNPPFLLTRYGRTFNKFTVIATKYNRNWPGHFSDVLFAVEGLGFHNGVYGVLYMWGFYSEQECWDFLTGRGQKEYHSHDREGVPISEVRERLGLPDSWVTRYYEVVA